MRVLYLCHRIPYPPDKGDKIRAFHQLRALAAAGHEVDVFTLADDPRDLEHRSALLEYCRHVTVCRLDSRVAKLRAIPYLLTGKPLTLPYFYSAALWREMRNALKEHAYDRIFVYCSAMAQYLDGSGTIPLITDLVDVDSDKWTQYAGFTRFPFSAVYRREGRTLATFERHVCERSSCIIVTTEREARLVRQLSPSAHVVVISNGVDGEFFQPSNALPPPETPTIGFTGDMSYFPNEEAVTYFARQVFPLIRGQLPGVKFLIIGRNPTRNVRELANIPGIEVTGYVPDVRAHLHRIHVSVVPFSIAAGIQNKILEAMACGLPVVGTARAMQGLAENCARALDIAGSAEEMSEKIVALFRNPQLARSKGLEARRCVLEEYNWDRSLRRLIELVRNPSSGRDWKRHDSPLVNMGDR